MRRRATSSGYVSRAVALLLAALLACLVWKLHGTSEMLPSSSASNPSRFVESRPKIAFLFLARNRILTDFLWDRFFKGSKEHEFTVYIHARPGFVYNEQTTSCPHFYNRQLPNSILIEWGEASMVEAERLLLRKALEDPFNERFILLSESCVPLYNFNYIYDYVMASPRSFVDSFRDTRENRYNPRMAPVVPRENWRKGSQWFVLIRKHAEAIAEDEDILAKFGEHCKRGALPEFWREYNVNAYKQSGKNCVPDEHYIQTVLSTKGFEHELERHSVTYSLWQYGGHRRKQRQSWHPITFTDVNMKTIKEMQAIDHIRYDTEWRVEWCSVNGDPHPCFLFARKFTKAAGLKLLNMTSDATATSITDIHLYRDHTNGGKDM